ncbi:SANT/Myb_domain [Hexamita inflata]|uniref:SANT/Myb domain n=1 Tax=Hexamita inflata TaxID=28002 RepID=A0AA86NCE1_9EUKA|nr:SANT/Myb domain [Hexamita inflata]
MKSVKQQWSLAEIRKLQICTELQSKSKGVDWALVAKQMKSRTQSQCKSYYQNVLKPTLNQNMRKNHMWTKVELFSLWTYAVNYNYDFTFIKTLTNMFDQFTAKQLYSQWNQLLIKQKLVLAKCKHVEADNSGVIVINNRDLKTCQFLLRCASVRWNLIKQKFFNCSTEMLEDNGYTVDITEIKAIESFFQNIDIQQLLTVFTEEIVLRKLQEIQW